MLLTSSCCKTNIILMIAKNLVIYQRSCCVSVRIMPRASHKDTDKRRVNQVNENSKLKSEIYEMQRLYIQREDEH